MEDVFGFTLAEELEMGARLLLAAALGAAIGYERRHSGNPAGLRTLSLVSMGAALFTLISVFGFKTGDPARVAAQIVTGIGFLGAGTILRSRADVRGLTTAASIWLTAAVGMAAGVGMYILALVTTVLAVIILYFLTRKR